MALARTTDCVGRGTMGGGGMADAVTGGPFRGAACCGEDEGCAGSATCAAWAMIGVSAGGRGLAMTCTDPDPLAGCPAASVAVGEDMCATGCAPAGGTVRETRVSSCRRPRVPHLSRRYPISRQGELSIASRYPARQGPRGNLTVDTNFWLCASAACRPPLALAQPCNASHGARRLGVGVLAWPAHGARLSHTAASARETA